MGSIGPRNTGPLKPPTGRLTPPPLPTPAPAEGDIGGNHRPSGNVGGNHRPTGNIGGNHRPTGNIGGNHRPTGNIGNVGDQANFQNSHKLY